MDGGVQHQDTVIVKGDLGEGTASLTATGEAEKENGESQEDPMTEEPNPQKKKFSLKSFKSTISWESVEDDFDYEEHEGGPVAKGNNHRALYRLLNSSSMQCSSGQSKRGVLEEYEGTCLYC